MFHCATAWSPASTTERTGMQQPRLLQLKIKWPLYSQFKSLESSISVSTIYMYLLSSESELCPNTFNTFTAFSGRLFKECSAVTLHERVTSLLSSDESSTVTESLQKSWRPP